MITTSCVLSMAAATFKTPDTGRYTLMGYSALILILGGYSLYLFLESRREGRK